jgi:hypothetical protein
MQTICLMKKEHKEKFKLMELMKLKSKLKKQ